MPIVNFERDGMLRIVYSGTVTQHEFEDQAAAVLRFANRNRQTTTEVFFDRDTVLRWLAES